LLSSGHLNAELQIPRIAKLIKARWSTWPTSINMTQIHDKSANTMQGVVKMNVYTSFQKCAQKILIALEKSFTANGGYNF
jgi:hypothetical protein